MCDEDTAESAEAIYAGARSRWDTSRYDEDVHYVIDITLTSSSVPIEIRYEGHAQPNQNRFSVNSFSETERLHPTVPHGINVTIGINGRAIRNFAPPLQSYDLLGVPDLSPTYSFGLRHESKPQAPARAGDPDVGALKNIATVSATRSVYDVTCIDSAVDAGGVRIDHLALTPLVEPLRNRIRELWVESGTHWTRRALISRNFMDGPPLHTAWSIEFVHDDRGQSIASEHALSALDYGTGKIYRDVTLSFLKVDLRGRAALDAFLFESDIGSAGNVLREP